jgi:hypothetical protein
MTPPVAKVAMPARTRWPTPGRTRTPSGASSVGSLLRTTGSQSLEFGAPGERGLTDEVDGRRLGKEG